MAPIKLDSVPLPLYRLIPSTVSMTRLLLAKEAARLLQLHLICIKQTCYLNMSCAIWDTERTDRVTLPKEPPAPPRAGARGSALRFRQQRSRRRRRGSFLLPRPLTFGWFCCAAEQHGIIIWCLRWSETLDGLSSHHVRGSNVLFVGLDFVLFRSAWLAHHRPSLPPFSLLCIRQSGEWCLQLGPLSIPLAASLPPGSYVSLCDCQSLKNPFSLDLHFIHDL